MPPAKIRLVVLVCLSCCHGGCGAAPVFAAEDNRTKDDKNPHLLEPRTTSVSVFKNGLGFFTREATATKRDGWVMAATIPPAKFGTLAIYSNNPDEVVDIVGSGPGEIVAFDDVDAPSTPQAKRQRLQATTGAKVQLTYEEHNDDRTAAGKLVSIGPSFAILDTGKQSIAVPIKSLTRMQILEMPLRIHVSSEARGDAASETARIGIAYLSQGITWIPEYTVKILDDEKAELTLRGTVVNEAEDLVHCDVNFVVGVPHFAHSGFMAPIAVGQTIRTIGSAVAPTALQSHIMNRAAIVGNDNTSDQFKTPVIIDHQAVRQPGDAAAALGDLPQMSGPGGNDFTIYTKRNMTLRRGERAIVKLFTKTIRYTHIYRWSPPNRLKHFLKLHNDSGSAWTTGPYLALSNGRPLSEDLLKYTPKAGHCEILMTAAINIAHSLKEMEIDRKLKAHSPSHNRYWDLVTLQGELRLRNFEKEAVEIVVTVPVQGKPLFASNDGSVSSDSTKLKLLERTGRVAWTVTLKPGEDIKLAYKYERFVPSR